MKKGNNTEHIISAINSAQIDMTDKLNFTNPEAKKEFLSNHNLTAPMFCYGKLDESQLLRNIESLEQLLVQKPSFDFKTNNLIELLIEDTLDMNHFVLACLQFNQSHDNDIAEKHRKYNQKLFGLPDKKEYLDILSQTFEQIDTVTLNSEQRKEYNELIAMFPELPNKHNQTFIPSEELITELHRKASEFYAPFLRHIPEGDTFSQEDICYVCRTILSEEFDGADEKWKVVFDKDRSFACVDQINRRIVFPGSRNQPFYSRDKFISLIAHEVGVHFLRELIFDDLAITPLRTGLPGYEMIDEGIAKVMEQVITGRYEPSGFIHYISIGLANFYHLSFREIFEIQKRLQHLANGMSEGSVFDSVRRALRGTNVLPNNKDLVYYNGATKIWKYVSNNIDSPYLFDDLLLSGKIDIFNISHQRIIYELKVCGVDW